jgi:hypothetical protein
MHGASDQFRALRHRAVVHVTQRQYRAVLFWESGQHALGDDAVQRSVPVVGRVDWFGKLGHRDAEPVVPAPVVVGELVARHPEQPRHGHRRRRVLAGGIHRRQEGFRRQVLGRSAVTAAPDEVPVHDRQGIVV